jgi:hypothetical protein
MNWEKNGKGKKKPVACWEALCFGTTTVIFMVIKKTSRVIQNNRLQEAVMVISTLIPRVKGVSGIGCRAPVPKGLRSQDPLEEMEPPWGLGARASDSVWNVSNRKRMCSNSNQQFLINIQQKIMFYPKSITFIMRSHTFFYNIRFNKKTLIHAFIF